MKMLLPQEEKEEFQMDFVKTSEAYGYETIADAEEKALAAKYEEGRDEGIGIGMERGREEGIGIGVERERREMAKGFRDAGIPLELIARQTGLSEEEIQNL
ncbi:hypothetical protein [uncultured Fibrobacter sp.]|nr:hypothetical protein [uncultured Fibrobacter sp.]